MNYLKEIKKYSDAKGEDIELEQPFQERIKDKREIIEQCFLDFNAARTLVYFHHCTPQIIFWISLASVSPSSRRNSPDMLPSFISRTRSDMPINS